MVLLHPLFTVIVAVLVVTVTISVSDVEMNALLELHTCTRGEWWSWRPSHVRWNFTRDNSGKFMHDPCSSEWEGLRCSKTPQKCSIQECEITRIVLPSLNLTGYIPSEVQNISALEVLQLNYNSLSGTIPSEMCNLTLLTIVSLEYNTLTGTIPSDIGKLKRLQTLDLEFNRLSGHIPSGVGQLLLLNIFDLESNLLTGTIPSEIGYLASLPVLNLQKNLLTGSIPQEIGQLTTLRSIDVASNLMAGPIPSELGRLSRLNKLDLDGNSFTGTLPRQLGNLTNLVNFAVVGSQLTGTIPGEIGNMAAMEVLSLEDNSLTGCIPSELGRLVEMTYFNVENNMLVGSVPTSFESLRSLESLFLQNNALTGRIDGIFNATAQTRLMDIDLSNNLLSGHNWERVFLLPEVRVVAMSVNCFEEELSGTLCAASSVEVLSLNGLGSAKGCKGTIKFPFSGVSLFNEIGGTLPECVWHLRNLSVLHMTGNGLTGSIISELPLYSSMVDLSLSHNKLSGQIPLGVEIVQRVDLSYNQFSGKYTDMSVVWKNQVTNLEINRLSGQLPVSKLENISSLNILMGNIYSCDSIPANDEHREDYICGSETLNESLYVFGSVALVLGCFVLMTFLVRVVSSIFDTGDSTAWVTSVSVKLNKVSGYLSFIEDFQKVSGENSSLCKIAALTGSFQKVVYIFIQLTVVVLVLASPIYILRGSDSNNTYSTHTTTYAWFWTLAYVHGEVLAGLILVMWVVAITICFYHMILAPSTESCVLEELEVRKDLPLMIALTCTRAPSWRTGASLIMNAAITIAVNAAYVYSTQQPLPGYAHFFIQVGFALFRLAYAYCVFPFLARAISDPVANVGYRLRLLTVNNLIIPCFATAFTSPACFQGLFVAAGSVSTAYTYEECLLFVVSSEGTTCSFWNTVKVDTAAVTPPFTYNHQCSSVLLTAYIPVLILGFSIQLVLCFCLPAVLTYFENSLDIQRFIQYRLLKGVLFPDFWLDTGDDPLTKSKKELALKDPSIILNPKTILCFGILNGLMVMLSFGLCSPILTMALACAVVLQMYMWTLLMGRFCSVLADCNRSMNFALVALAEVQLPLRDVFQQSFWLIAWCTASFCALLCWDIAADSVGWVESIWVPITTLCYPIVLWVVSVGQRQHKAQRSISKEGVELGPSICATDSATCNPLRSL